MGAFLAARVGHEPFPALIQPSFSYVLDAEHTLEWVEVRYTVTFPGGRTEVVDYHDFLPGPDEKDDTIAWQVFTPAAASDPETAAWVRDRLADLGYDGKPERLTVTNVDVAVDLGTDGRTEGDTQDTIAVVELTP